MLCSFWLFFSVYFEGVTWDDLSDGFEVVPGGTAYRNRSVLSYHFYEPPQVSINSCAFVKLHEHSFGFSLLLRNSFLKELKISRD